MIKYNADDGRTTNSSSLLAAEKDFDGLYYFGSEEIDLIMLFLQCPQSYRVRVNEIQPQYLNIACSRELAPIKRFLEEHVRARCSSPHTTVKTWAVEKGDEKGTHLITKVVMRHIRLHHKGAYTRV